MYTFNINEKIVRTLQVIKVHVQVTFAEICMDTCVYNIFEKGAYYVVVYVNCVRYTQRMHNTYTHPAPFILYTYLYKRMWRVFYFCFAF